MLLSNGLHHSENLPVKFGFSPRTVPANIAKKLPAQRCSKPHFIAFFSLSHKRPTFAFTGESGYTLGFRRRIAHSGLHAETQGFTLVVAWRFISHLTFGQAKAGGSGCTPTACVRFLRRRSPAGLRNFGCKWFHSMCLLPLIHQSSTGSLLTSLSLQLLAARWAESNLKHDKTSGGNVPPDVHFITPISFTC